MVKNVHTGGYQFNEQVMPSELVDKALADKK
jgi:hypothetical protein